MGLPMICINTWACQPTCGEVWGSKFHHLASRLGDGHITIEDIDISTDEGAHNPTKGPIGLEFPGEAIGGFDDLIGEAQEGAGWWWWWVEGGVIN